ncbi:MAG TPA: hypothetical protein VD973_14865 [Symbiobacteriaceae bacterium]|jgi:hypothetical protein|nr:hypothetical protein [Symbiobacteriaceae bacterium]
MGELEQLVAKVESALQAHLKTPDWKHGKVSVWMKLVRPMGQSQEETVGDVHKVLLTATSYDDLLSQVAENLVVAAFGGDVQLVDSMPNVIVKLFDKKAYVAVPGAPPLDQAGQIFLKATVYKWEPSLWDQIFGGKKKERMG